MRSCSDVHPSACTRLTTIILLVRSDVQVRWSFSSAQHDPEHQEKATPTIPFPTSDERVARCFSGQELGRTCQTRVGRSVGRGARQQSVPLFVRSSRIEPIQCSTPLPLPVVGLATCSSQRACGACIFMVRKSRVSGGASCEKDERREWFREVCSSDVSAGAPAGAKVPRWPDLVGDFCPATLLSRTKQASCCSNIYAKKRGIGKKLILTIRAVMLHEKVDLVAGDFNGAAWRRDNSNFFSIIEEVFADCALPMPPGPTPLWGSWSSSR